MKQPVTANQRKLIASLQQARHRRALGLFVIEGTRSVLDSARCFEIEMLVATPAWLEEHGHRLPPHAGTLLTARAEDMKQMSSMVTPQGVLAVCRIPASPESFEPGPDELILALDRVQDPGNMGTIMRVADWFGINRIIASPDTVDIYNPKVIQATMGAIARVQVLYMPLAPTLRVLADKGIEIYGTFLGGEPLYASPLSKGGGYRHGKRRQRHNRRDSIRHHPAHHHPPIPSRPSHCGIAQRGSGNRHNRRGIPPPFALTPFPNF